MAVGPREAQHIFLSSYELRPPGRLEFSATKSAPDHPDVTGCNTQFAPYNRLSLAQMDPIYT